MIYNIHGNGNFITARNDNGFEGSVKVQWIKENQWSVAHYEAFVAVPFQDTQWVNLFVYNKEELNEAISKAKEVLVDKLSRCTFI